MRPYKDRKKLEVLSRTLVGKALDMACQDIAGLTYCPLPDRLDYTDYSASLPGKLTFLPELKCYTKDWTIYPGDFQKKLHGADLLLATRHVKFKGAPPIPTIYYKFNESWAPRRVFKEAMRFAKKLKASILERSGSLYYSKKINKFYQTYVMDQDLETRKAWAADHKRRKSWIEHLTDHGSCRKPIHECLNSLLNLTWSWE